MFLIKSWFKSNHSSLTLCIHKRWFPLKVKWILTYIFLSLRILFFRISVKAAPVQATQYVKLGSLIKGIDVFAMKGCTKELIVFKVNLGVILMLKKRPTNIKKAKANKKKHKIWQAASFKKKMIKNKFMYFWSSQWCFSRLITSQGK